MSRAQQSVEALTVEQIRPSIISWDFRVEWFALREAMCTRARVEV